jgi:hypothetical protein
MRVIFSIIFSFFVTTVFGQISDTSKKHAPLIQGHRLSGYLDSLKAEILADTLKFDPKDLVFTAIGRQNTKPYSKLFIVNGVYFYKLDIIEGSKVLEFANVMLNENIIKSITYMDGTEASKYFGKNTWQGLIVITTFDKSKFNPEVAGLMLLKGKLKSGDNFTFRKKGEIIIRE